MHAVKNTEIANIKRYDIFFMIFCLVFLIFIVTEIDFNTEISELDAKQLKCEVVRIA